MATIYRKGKAEKIWIRYKDATGRWRGKPTGYRWDNTGDLRQARLLARRQSEIEAERREISGMRLMEWVPAWLIDKYGHLSTSTPDRYMRSWRRVSRYLDDRKILTAAQIRRELIGDYLGWRSKSAGRNTAIGELKLLAMIVDEAIRLDHCAQNPLRRAGLRKTKPAEKMIWSDADICRAAQHIEWHGTHWMRCAFFLGLYQACRLRQCQLPLTAIRLDYGIIQYPDAAVKGGIGFAQPIDPRFRAILNCLVRQAPPDAGLLCRIPWDASLRLRRTFDRAGLPRHCHHGLRATWITRAAEVGVPESQAMAFCHHSCREVHRIYKRLSSIGIAHVPALVSLPDFSFGDGAGDSLRATRDSAAP